jgi:hypothetical protein
MTGISGDSVAIESPCGTFISSTMMVMMMATTPSKNASSRFFPIFPYPYDRILLWQSGR